MQADEVFKLSELTRYIQQVLSLNFESSFWIEAEVSQVSVSRGNYYLDLVEKDPDSEELLATLPGRIWRTNQVIIRRKINADISEFLQSGVKVKLRGSIKFHSVYGISFQIDDIDQDFTLGELERKKLEVIDRLQTEGVFKKNKQFELPPVLQRLAVISSRTAAGLADFVHQLEYNTSDIPFSIDIYHAAVQGNNAPGEIISALDEINAYAEYYDVICILRGGGSKLDLSAFDDEALCRKIGDMSLPVITGIGHEIDTSVVDLTANRFLKTPTALAAFLIEENLGFLNFLYEQYQKSLLSANRQVQYIKDQLRLVRRKSELKADKQLYQVRQQLLEQSRKSEYVSGIKISEIKKELDLIKIRALASDPAHILKRGFSLVSQQDSIIKSAKDINKVDVLTIQFHDGQLKTNIA